MRLCRLQIYCEVSESGNVLSYIYLILTSKEIPAGNCARRHGVCRRATGLSPGRTGIGEGATGIGEGGTKKAGPGKGAGPTTP